MIISDQNGFTIKMNNKSNTKKNSRLRKIGIIIVILILIVIASYFVVFQNQFGSPSPTIILDDEQEQIDNFLANYKTTDEQARIDQKQKWLQSRKERQ